MARVTTAKSPSAAAFGSSSPRKKADTHAAPLRDLAVQHSQNTTASPTTPNSLAEQLKKFHIHTPKKGADPDGILRNKSPRKIKSRPALGTNTFVAPQKHPVEKHAHFDIPSTPPAAASPEPKSRVVQEPPATPSHTLRVSDPIAKKQLAKHRAATPLGGDEELLTDESLLKEAETMSEPQPTGKYHIPIETAEPQLDESTEPNRISPKSLVNGKEGGFTSPFAPRSPNPVLRIEDSFEELDRLEEEFEAVDHIVQVDRVPSPDKVQGVTKSGPKRTTSTSKKPTTKLGSVRARPNDISRTGSLRKLAAQNGSRAAEKSTSDATPKKAAARPASLLPPKPLARSEKPKTMPTFELPGEAVARRLKEQKEARMAGLVVVGTPASVPSPPKARSTKAPTRPTFELPGEAISRRKREEHEAKLRAQQEEERKRREFKARPVRNSIAPGSLPRETVASRARQSKAPTGENGETTASTSMRRQSTVSSVRSAQSAASNSQSRGRGLAVGSPSTGQPSRATSSSTGSLSGKRSIVSAEDVHQQRLRGKEVLSRDNSVSADREREKRDRESVAKTARQEAAERTRILSREWAEKQKQKLKKAMPGASPGSSNVAVR